MSYTIEYSKIAQKQIKKMDRYTQTILMSWITKNLVNCTDPRQHGKALVGNKKGQWRYRIGDYRLICDIQDDKMIILALNVGHRKEVYL